MTRKTPPVNVSASVRARLLKLAKERRDDFTLTLVNCAAERFLYRLSRSKQRALVRRAGGTPPLLAPALARRQSMEGVASAPGGR